MPTEEEIQAAEPKKADEAKAAEEAKKAEQDAAKQAEQQQKDFEKWLADQPESVQQMYSEHVSGLKSALSSERDKNKGVGDQLKRLAELEKADEERKAAEMTEVERLQAEKEKLEKQLAERDAEAKRSQFKADVVAAASKLNFIDPEDAVRFVDEGAEDVAEAVKALAGEKPHLLHQEGKKPPPKLGANNPGNAGANQGSMTDDERREFLGLK